MPTRPEHPWLAELTRLNEVRERLRKQTVPSMTDAGRLIVNPALELLTMRWRNLPSIMDDAPGANQPAPGDELVLVWRHPAAGPVHTATARSEELLALKIVLEDIPLDVAAGEAGVSTGALDRLLDRAVDNGILLSPPSRIRRPLSFTTEPTDDTLPAARIFTLQWHITQACDLHCRHCYDRSSRQDIDLAAGLRVLDGLRDFCRSRFVRGQVSFTGGNPFLHPDFIGLYSAAVERGFTTAILGNPVARDRIRQVLAIEKPSCFQISLEGLEAHNDAIRGRGHFSRSLDFLELLREEGVPSEVMLTLTRDNMRQVVPLGELLRGRTGAFSFNRLALFGEGADLSLPTPPDYRAFLHDYLAAMAGNPVLGMKDSLFNIILAERGEFFDGCTGFGCGAAFNFLALLADGEVHACRKFPSFIGSVRQNTLIELYDSPIAQDYREGSSACSGCPHKPVCGGCAAVTASLGENPATSRDPFCFRPLGKS